MAKLMRPETLDEALDALRAGAGAVAEAAAGRKGEGTFPFAGGTDLIVHWKRGGVALSGVAVDIKGIASLGRIAVEDECLFIGPCTSLATIAKDELVNKLCPVLAEAAGIVACPQVRNRATLGGNLCNASPAADTAIPLLLADALLEVRSATARREIAACDFFTGPGESALEPGELLTGIRIPFDGVTAPPVGLNGAGECHGPRVRIFSAYRKFGTRPAMEIAIVAVGAALLVDRGTVMRARVACGSVAPVPLRCRTTEARLEGRPLDDAAIEAARVAVMEEVSPISDVRASADYRREITGITLRRILEDARQD